MKSCSSRTIHNRGQKPRNRRYVGTPLLLGFAIGLCATLNASPANQMKFHSPSFEEPVYRIQFPFVVEGDKVVVKNLELNGANPGAFVIFKDGKSIAPSSPLEAGVYAFVFDYAWAGGKPYKVKLVVGPENGGEPKSLEFAGSAPKTGGIPGGREGFYRAYQVEEEAGIPRSQEVITFTLTAPIKDLDPPDIVIFDGDEPIPFDIMEKMESIPPEAVSANHPVTSTLKIALPLDVRAHEKKLLLVLKGDQGAAPLPGLSVSGEGLGKRIAGSRLVLELHPQSGQINTIESPDARVRLFNEAGVIHWNPDVFVPGEGWDHSFDWNPPPKTGEKAGIYLYLNSRRGPLPRVKGVALDVKYRLEAEAPYFISETRLVFEEDRGVIAVRNDEMVLSRTLFDSLVYKDKKGEVIKRPLLEKPGMPFGLVHIAPEGLDWVGLVNTREEFGFFSLRLNAASGNFETPGDFFHKAGTYFYAPAEGKYVYWVRPFVYTWADHFTGNLFTFVPKGSFFYEKNAYLVMRLQNNFPSDLDSLLIRLRHPLRVY